MELQYQWVVSQIGARQHYSVPRGFQSTGQLKHFYTDAWCPGYLRWIRRLGSRPLRAFAGRWHQDLPPHKVTHYDIRSVYDGTRHRLRSESPIEWRYHEYLKIGQRFDQSVCDDIVCHRRVEPGRDAFFGFNTGSLNTLRTLRELGVRTVLDQIDPAKVEEEIVLAEIEKWPGWELNPGLIPQAYWDHMSAEWAAADIVLVNSNWSRSALISQGVPAGKIRVAPIAYESQVKTERRIRNTSGSLTVLWLGSVILRKGIQYLIEAAKLLKGRPLRFVVAGPIGISEQALATAPENMTFLGRVTRDQAEEIYSRADMFVLPTLSDGFALTQVEAISNGLPVIATPNCGDVVTHGRSGLIVPASNGRALAEAIASLDDDRSRLAQMSHEAITLSKLYTLPSNTRMAQIQVQEWESVNR